MRKTSLATRKLNEEIVARILKESASGSCPRCPFTQAELFSLLEKFAELAGPSGKITRAAFRLQLHEVFHVTEDVIMDRVFHTFDRDNDGLVSLEDYIWGMGVFLRGSLEERIPFVFAVYTMKRDSQITREEMFHMLKSSLVRVATDTSEDDPEETTREVVEIVFKKLDVNHDGKCDFLDFQTAVRQDDLLLECLGQCLPSQEDVDKFMASLPKVI